MASLLEDIVGCYFLLQISLLLLWWLSCRLRQSEAPEASIVLTGIRVLYASLPAMLLLWVVCLWLPTWSANSLSVLVTLAWSMLLVGVVMGGIHIAAQDFARSACSAFCTFAAASLSALVTSLAVGVTFQIIAARLREALETMDKGWYPPWLLRPLETMDISSFGTVKSACREVKELDSVTNSTEGMHCAMVCRGWDLYLPMIVRARCLKAEAWMTFSQTLPVGFGGFGISLPLSLLMALLYALPAIGTTYRSWPGSYKSMSVTEDAADPSGSRTAQALVRRQAQVAESVGVTVVGPSATEFRPDGPFFSPGTLDIQEHMIKSRTTNDRQAAILSSQIAVAFNVLEVLGDINSSFGLLALGQPFYAMAMLASILLPNMYDPFQTDFAKELAASTADGMVSKEVLEHQRREGVIEGSISAIIAICALIRTPMMTPFAMASLAFTIGTSLAISIPTGSKANALLEAGANINDYYQLNEAKKRLKSAHKYLFSALSMSCGSAFGLSFVDHELFNCLIWTCVGFFSLIFAFLAKDKSWPLLISNGIFSMVWIARWNWMSGSLAKDSTDDGEIRVFIFLVLGSFSCLAAWPLGCTSRLQGPEDGPDDVPEAPDGLEDDAKTSSSSETCEDRGSVRTAWLPC